MSSSILFLLWHFFFCRFLVLSFLLVVLLIFFFFSGPRSGACSVSDPGLLTMFINKSIKVSTPIAYGILGLVR